MGAIILAPALAITIFECLLRVECVRVRHFYSGHGVESSIGSSSGHQRTVPGHGSGAGDGGGGVVIEAFGVETQVTNQLDRGLTPCDPDAGETTPNHFALQSVSRVAIRVDES
jgi:hypothetical protein